MDIKSLIAAIRLAERSGSLDTDQLGADFVKQLSTKSDAALEDEILGKLDPSQVAKLAKKLNATNKELDKYLTTQKQYKQGYEDMYKEDAAAAKKKALLPQAAKGITGLANNLAGTNVQIASLLGQALQAMQPSAKSKEVYGSDIVSSAIPLAAAKMQINPRITHSAISSVDKITNDIINERNLLDQRAEMMAYQQMNPANQGFWLAWNGVNSAANKQALQQAKQNAGE